jgi:DNA-binding transcriptional LysR family regulator
MVSLEYPKGIFMELRHLRYFLAVAEELHFGRAAERLGIEQPPLSRQIQNLEADLGARLFDRTKRRVGLTAQGRFLKVEAARLLEQADLVRNNIRLLEEGTSGTVRLGYVGAAMYSLLPAVLTALRARCPDLGTQLVELGNEEQVRALGAGEIDLGFVRSPLEAKGLTVRPAFLEPYALVLPRAHPLAGQKRVALAAVAEEPFVSFARECAPGMVDEIHAICRRAGFAPRLAHSTSQIHTILRLVESGLGYSIVPASVGSRQDFAVRFVELHGIPERTGLSVLSNPALQSPQAARVLEVVRLLERRGRGGWAPLAPDTRVGGELGKTAHFPKGARHHGVAGPKAVRA